MAITIFEKHNHPHSFPISVFSLLPLKDTVVLALNQDYIERDTHITLKPGDEIAVIPPISGG